MESGGNHEQQKRAVEPTPEARWLHWTSEMQQRGDKRADIDAGAPLAARQQFAAGRPGVREVLAAEVTEKLVEKIQHGQGEFTKLFGLVLLSLAPGFSPVLMKWRL
jgi:hypothetical protein